MNDQKINHFSIPITPAIEIALDSIPMEALDLVTLNRGRHCCLKAALREGICAIARAFEDGVAEWQHISGCEFKFEFVPLERGSMDSTAVDFHRRALDVDNTLKKVILFPRSE